MSEKLPVERYLTDLRKGIERVRKYPSKEIILLHHNDSDGLTSGAILLKAFGRAGYDVKRYSLEKPYPAVLDKLFRENKVKIIVFADFAGRIAPMISTLNSGRNLVLLLDHHRAEKATDDSVLNLDPDLYGLRGDRDISASVVCYYFARELDSANKDLVHIAAFGGIADFYYLDRKVHSCNRECFEEAVGAGLMRSESRDGEERFIVRLGEKEVDVVDFYPSLDIAGGAGFYGGGPELGISILLEGLDSDKLARIEDLGKTKERIFSAELERIKNGGINETGNIQWFDAGERFSPMGVKMIGIFCEEIADMGFLDHSKYLAGFQRIPDTVPGFGDVKMGQTKVSMRSSSELSEKITGKKMPGMNDFLPEATLNLGGFADACHSIAAATTIEAGRERELMEETQRVLESKMKEMEV